jgi:hypothetical protein
MGMLPNIAERIRYTPTPEEIATLQRKGAEYLARCALSRMVADTRRVYVWNGSFKGIMLKPDRFEATFWLEPTGEWRCVEAWCYPGEAY